MAVLLPVHKGILMLQILLVPLRMFQRHPTDLLIVYLEFCILSSTNGQGLKLKEPNGKLSELNYRLELPFCKESEKDRKI